jgi:hypothetical protein
MKSVRQQVFRASVTALVSDVSVRYPIPRINTCKISQCFSGQCYVVARYRPYLQTCVRAFEIIPGNSEECFLSRTVQVSLKPSSFRPFVFVTGTLA